jgi:hypothetical protein
MVPIAVHPPESLEVSQAAPSGTLTATLVAAIGAALIVLPAFTLLYASTRRSLLPADGTD